jgi:ubiquinone/menaquinone biosynthesis C-methylase UbiE
MKKQNRITWKKSQETELEWWNTVKDRQHRYEISTYLDRRKRLLLDDYDFSKGGIGVVDVGAGPHGGIIALLPNAKDNHYAIVDPLIGKYAKTFELNKDIIYFEGTAEEMPFIEDESVDVLICTNTIDHTKDPIKALEEFRRVLKVGGRLCLHVYLNRAHGSSKHPHTISMRNARQWKKLFSRTLLFENDIDRTGKDNFYGVFEK